MSPRFALLLAFGIGVVAGLRSLTAPAVVAWAAHLGWIDLSASPLRWMGSVWAVGIFTLLAALELVADQLPNTPARTTVGPLIGRIVMGMLAGACLGTADAVSLWVAALVGAVGGGSVRRLSGSGELGAAGSPAGFRDRAHGRSDRDRAWIVHRLQILT